MARFPMCPSCQAEYEDPADRRFHAQPNACPECGPRAWLEDAMGRHLDCHDAVADAASRLVAGEIVAIKGIGGFHLACLATDKDVVERLRNRKHRYQKALAMMARDTHVIRRYAEVSPEAEALLRDQRAPIVLVPSQGESLPDAIAPGQSKLGFMLPYTPLHHILLEAIDMPVVMTSGNLSDEPQVIDNNEAREKLSGIADAFLMHDRDIVNRLDDSVVSANPPQMFRRARGYAPDPIRLDASFSKAPSVLAMGGELKNTFCLLQGDSAVVSQHIGDTEDAAALDDYLEKMDLYAELYDFSPDIVVVDPHPEYLPTKIGREMEIGADVVEVQHHHAHLAACLAEHGFAVDSLPVLGVLLDGLGFGEDGTLWGGEFLKGNFTDCERLAHFQPVPMPGGVLAMKEPWRNLWSHLQTAFGWEFVRRRYPDAPILQRLSDKPVERLEAMTSRQMNSPTASSAGRVFDAVAAALSICFDGMSHEAQAAMELEALAEPYIDDEKLSGYMIDRHDDERKVISWQSLWRAVLDDLAAGTEPGRIAARFHAGLASAIVALGIELASREGLSTVVLSGGVFQNSILLRLVEDGFTNAGLSVLYPQQLPANDGGLSLGQAAVAAARSV